MTVGAAQRPAVAGGDSSSALDVTINGNPVDVASALSGTAYDQTNAPYTECFPSGASSTVVLTGWSMDTVLKASGVTESKVTSVSVARQTSSGSVVLRPADVDPEAPGYPTFTDGPALLVPRQAGSLFTFFRPYRGAGCADDPNGGDYVVPGDGGTLSVAIASGTVLSVTSAQDRSRASVGQPVSYSGSVSDPPAGRQLAYRWTFGDGTTAMGQDVTHSFSVAGTYSAVLSVSSGEDAGGQAAPLSVTVGSVPATTASPAADGGRPGATHAPTRAPVRSPAATPRAGATRASTSSPTPGATPGPNTAGPGGNPPAVAPGSPVTGPVGTAAAPTVAGPTAAEPTPAPSRSATPSPAPARQPAGVQVAGLLISRLDRPAAAPTGLSAAVAAALPGAAAAATDVNGSSVPLAAAGTGLAGLLLLGAGAVLELRRSSR